jgi:hypothetical protein
MRAAHTRSRRSIAVLATIVAFATTAAVPAIAAAPEAPINDNYLASLNLNAPGTPLNREDTLSDLRNTSGATVQSDILSPPSHGGPAELTGCNGVTEGKTIWYDLYPDAEGLLRVRTSADFGTVMAVMPFDPHSLLPDNTQRVCTVNQPTAAGELFDKVQAGKAYTVQIGGVAEAGGSLQVLFDYLVQPKRLQAETTLTAQPLSSGVRVVSLSVSAPKKARVEVRCTRGCGPQARTAASVGFPRLRGATLPSGSSLKIYVTAKNEIGAFIEYKIGRGRFKKVQKCLAPGSKKPETCE